jgi:hypothetical protein
MALPLSNTLEGTDSTQISTGNSANPNAFDTIVGSGTPVVYDTDLFMHGTSSALVTQGASPAEHACYWTTGSIGGAQSVLYGRIYYRHAAVPANNFHLVTFWGAAIGGTIDIDTDGKVSVLDSTFTNKGSSPSSLSTATWYRIEFHYQGHASTGEIDVNLYVGDSTSVFDTAGGTAGNFRTDIDAVGWGINAVAANHVFNFDTVNLNGTGFPGPAVTALAAKHFVTQANRQAW